jgi:hypothetical protein
MIYFWLIPLLLILALIIFSIFLKGTKDKP